LAIVARRSARRVGKVCTQKPFDQPATHQPCETPSILLARPGQGSAVRTNTNGMVPVLLGKDPLIGGVPIGSCCKH
jgi:hypothetical protein